MDKIHLTVECNAEPVFAAHLKIDIEIEEFTGDEKSERYGNMLSLRDLLAKSINSMVNLSPEASGDNGELVRDYVHSCGIMYQLSSGGERLEYKQSGIIATCQDVARGKLIASLRHDHPGCIALMGTIEGCSEADVY